VVQVAGGFVHPSKFTVHPVFFEVAVGAEGMEGGEEVLGKICPRGGRWACGGCNMWEDVVVGALQYEYEGVGVSGRRVECIDSGVEVNILEVLVEVDSWYLGSCQEVSRMKLVIEGSIQCKE